ncbi:MAG: hypothetical protein NVSMB25_05000 [Thermoleophilaceae bacterium]
MRSLRFIAVVVLVTFAELYVTVHIVPDAIGPPATIGLVIASSLLGGWLLKQQGRLVWRRFAGALGAGRLPSQEIVDGVLVLLGGAFLIVPGFVTDVIGLFLLLPPTRPLARRAVESWLRRRGVSLFSSFPRRPAPPGDTVEGSAADRGPEQRAGQLPR